MKLSIIITAWEEPLATKECIKRFLIQDLPKQWEMFVVCPDEPTAEVIKEYQKKHKNIIHIHQDRVRGKNMMLVELINKAKGEVLIFTDGDIFVSNNSVKEILDKFKDKNVGAVTGRPISSNPKDSMVNYWGHLLVDAGAHNIRKERYKKGEFLECSGYLFAIRKGIINDMPLDVAEDSIIPALIYSKGYKIAYAERATALTQYPNNFKDWINQKTRCAKAHERLNNYVDVKKMKSFKNEVFKGTWWALTYPKNIKEFIWTLALFPARLYAWYKVFYETKIKNQHYGDKWKRVTSTRPMD